MIRKVLSRFRLFLLSFLFMSGRQCVFATTFDRQIHTQRTAWQNILIFPPSPCSRRATAAWSGISSGIKFLVTNFVTFTSPRESKSRAWHARHIHNGRPLSDIGPDHHCGKRSRLPFDSSKLRQHFYGDRIASARFVEKIVAAPAAVIVRRGRPTG